MVNGRTIQVLEKLLERVPDGNTLEKLLDAENLLNLLQKYGWDKASVRQALTGGKIPGDLLLELLDKEPDTGRLLAQLGITIEKPVEQQQPKQAAQTKPPEPVNQTVDIAPATAPTPAPNPAPNPLFASNPLPVTAMLDTPEVKKRGNLLGNYHSIVVLTIFALSAVMPALIITGFMPGMTVTKETATIIALVGGAIAGALADSETLFSWQRMIVGIVYSVSTLWATILYTQARTSIFRVEIVIPLILGGIPAVIVYYALSRIGKPAK